MHTSGSPSTWRAREDASRDVLVALYLRDALGVIDPSGLPRLLGTGLPASTAPADEMTGWAWIRWWVSVVEPEAGIPALPEHATPAWEAAVHKHLDDARTWADVAHQEYGIRLAERAFSGETGDTDAGVLSELVAEREQAAGTHADFDLRIEVLPLTTAGIWWIGDNAIAVDELLREKPDDYRQALAPIVERLVPSAADRERDRS
ncbi:hypothetical protein [Schumannella soli]|uniref:Zinc-binding alcohol dehydrogenase n=1 Tax=Schumannella soli TaxID=2590779 RepID=A0A506XXI0_9MICO|nr:hypothetical protein [Schumannella soli]TPW77604.1 hypothetical protein FJ657_02745 [Schumannella soli]